MISRKPLNENPYTWQASRNGSLRIFYTGKLVKTLAGRQGVRLAIALESAESDRQQGLLARASGHFKHGNE